MSWGSPKGKEALSEDFVAIEGHLAAKPVLERSGKRLIIYIGDKEVLDEKDVPPPIKDVLTGEEVIAPTGPTEAQPKLTNIRKAVTENEEEKWVLQQIQQFLAGDTMKIGPEGPTIRLFGKPIQGKRWQEHIGGIDFVFCFLGYDDPVTGRDTIVDTCFGDRWQNEFFQFLFEKGKDGIKAAPKAVF